jgi:hypothetical protein
VARSSSVSLSPSVALLGQDSSGVVGSDAHELVRGEGCYRGERMQGGPTGVAGDLIWRVCTYGNVPPDDSNKGEKGGIS